VAPALSTTGHADTAYALLLQQDCPSWLYALKHDATTIWERWDSTLPDGTVNPGEMTSFNHYALGAIAQWLHTTVAGLTANAPGYRDIIFRPRPGGGITWAGAAHESPYGRVAIQGANHRAHRHDSTDRVAGRERDHPADRNHHHLAIDAGLHDRGALSAAGAAGRGPCG